MSEPMSNDQYAEMILKALSTLQTGQCAGGIDEMIQLGGKTLAEANRQTLLNVVAGPGGLLGKGLVECQKVLLGNPSSNIEEIRGITITRAGRTHLKEQEASSPGKTATRVAWQTVKYVLFIFLGVFLTKLAEWVFNRLFH